MLSAEVLSASLPCTVPTFSADGDASPQEQLLLALYQSAARTHAGNLRSLVDWSLKSNPTGMETQANRLAVAVFHARSLLPRERSIRGWLRHRRGLSLEGEVLAAARKLRGTNPDKPKLQAIRAVWMYYCIDTLIRHDGSQS